MEFASQYLPALRENDPKLFQQLLRTGKMDEFLKERAKEAHDLKAQLLANEPKDSAGHPLDPQAELLAEERVMAQMLDFPGARAASRLSPR